MPKSALAAACCALVAGGIAAAAEPAVCRAGEDKVLSYAGGVAGFRPDENFIREWRREAPAGLVGAPRYIETLRFNGDDAALTYDYQLDDRRAAAGAAEDDYVHNAEGRRKTGATAYIQTFWNRDDKTLMAHIRCNDARRPEGDCRIDFDDARRLGMGGADGPVVALFLEADAPADLCALPFGPTGPWRLVLDGVAAPVIESPCAGRALAEAFVKAETAEARMPSTLDPDTGKEVVNRLGGADIAAARDLAAYVRTLNYARTPDQATWLDALIAESKTAFAKAGDNLRACTNREPPT